MSSNLWSLRLSRNTLTSLTRSSGQAVVEFTLVFLLFLIIAWVPADFGLAFYTGQLAQNASREGARIAAADPTLANGTLLVQEKFLAKRQEGFRPRFFQAPQST